MDMMRKSGDSCCVMEVSSHALSLERVESIRFDAAVFTNITQDHLDYHGSMEDYLACKVHLFDLLKKDGSALIGTYSPGYPRIPEAKTFGLRDEDDFRISGVTASLTGIKFSVEHEGESTRVEMRVPGGFNIYNATGAMAAAVERGIALDAAAEALRDFPGVPGRFQAVDKGQGFLVAVDYAHTPDALRRVLQQARELTENRVIVVFGAGGDRDSAKRPIMGGIATELADTSIVTSDNPRTEDPGMIIEDILRGIRQDSSRTVIVQPDRRSAIFEAVRLAEAGDVVIIAGKGHEDYQILGREKIHFDDREVALQALEEVLQ
jgi:UDP-N-acetylmuramoyl-L-alanyl-D-glutamate--2,6-diaminopimelate ligase